MEKGRIEKNCLWFCLFFLAVIIVLMGQVKRDSDSDLRFDALEDKFASLERGELVLNGLQLSAPIKSTATHCHGEYDNSFIAGFRYDDEGNPIEIVGSSLEALNIRATGGAMTAWYMLCEGALSIGGGLLFCDRITYDSTREGMLGLPRFHQSKLSITPNYITGEIFIVGEKGGVRIGGENGIEVVGQPPLKQQIKQEILKEIKELYE